MAPFLDALRRRKLVPWIAGYAAVAWVVLQLLDVLADLWSWPPVLGRVVFVVLAAGLAATAVLAWFHGERGVQPPTTVELGLLGLVVVAGSLAVGTVVRTEAGRGSPDPEWGATRAPSTALAVLPFTDNSPGGGHGYLGDGIAETLINGLSRLEDLRVVARTSAFGARELGDVREIGRLLGVGSVVEGTITRVGTRVRITANLIDARTGESLWADRFDDEVTEADLFDLQDEVARRIVDALRVELVGDARIVDRGSRSPEAQRAFYLGLHHWTARTTEDVVLATRYFQDAIAADSTWAEAWGGLALAYVLSTPSEYDVPGITRDEALARAQDAARRAIDLDPDVASAYAAMGDALTQGGERDEGERWLREAIARNPGYATARHWLGDLLMTKLEGGAALAVLDRAEVLDPTAPAILVERGSALMMLGRHDEAREQLNKAVGLHPDGRVVRTFVLYFALTMGDWALSAEQVEALGQILGDPEAGAGLRDALLDPDRRAGLLRRWADGIGTGAGPVESGLMGRFEVRFIALRHVDGDEAALDFFEAILSGPDAETVYPPVMPALMGPELVATERAHRVMEITARRGR